MIAALVILAAAAAALFLRPPRDEGPAPAFKRLTFRRGVVFRARFAPDGQTIVYSALWDGSPPELFTTRPEGTESRSLGLPDANLRAVSATGEMALELIPGHTLARAMLGGGAHREVLEDVKEADWTPDGKQMAVVRMPTRNRLEFPPGTVLYDGPPGHVIEDPRFSPSGDAVAFIEHDTELRGSLRLVDLSGRARTLLAGWEGLESLAWPPGGQEVWFSGSREVFGIHSIHAVSLAGRERVVLPAAGVIQDVSRDGRALVSRHDVRMVVHALPPGESSERDLSWLDGSYATDLSHDGETLLFYEWMEAGGPSFVTYIRDTDGSPAVRLGEGVGRALSPDGKWVFATPRAGGKAFRVPTGPGQAREVKTGAVAEFQKAEWSADGDRIAFVGLEPKKPWRLYVLDLDGDDPRPIGPSEGMRDRSFALSPDGRRVAATPWDEPMVPLPAGRGRSTTRRRGRARGRAPALERRRPRALRLPRHRPRRADLPDRAGDRAQVAHSGPPARGPGRRDEHLLGAAHARRPVACLQLPEVALRPLSRDGPAMIRRGAVPKNSG